MEIRAEENEILNIRFTLAEERVGQRLDVALTETLLDIPQHVSSEFPQWFLDAVPSRAKVSRWIEQGQVSVDGYVVSKPALRLKEAQIVEVIVTRPPPLALEPDSSVPIDVVFEDEAVLVVNKPAGLVVHPGAGNPNKTLVHGLLHHLGQSFRDVGGECRPGLVHRLDKETSGLMVVAKHERAFQQLVAQFLDRSISRSYLALTLSEPDVHERIDLPIGRDPRDRKRMAVVRDGGREAITLWKTIEVLKHGLLLELRLLTGRTHQIRVHLHATGAAIVGDQVYSLASDRVPTHLRSLVNSFARQALHAYRLEFVHPDSGEQVSFEVEPPKEMSDLLDAFR